MTGKTPRPAGPLIAAWICCALIAIGSIGPWVTVGIIHSGGLDNGQDGWVTLIVAAIVASAVWVMYGEPRSRTRLMPIAVIVIAGVALVTAITDINDVQSRHASLFGVDISPSPGWGLWLVALASGTLVLIGFSLVGQRERVADSYDPVLQRTRNDESPPAG
jgi:ABC-type branched-subunit amino acid transport system permease subunit